MIRIIALFIAIALLQPVCSLAQEPGTVSGETKNVQSSLGIAREMLKIIKELPDSFKTYKGGFAMKDEAGNSLYQANDTDLATNEQYVEVKKTGALVFMATWKKKDRMDKTPVLAFAAFTGGIMNVTDGMGYIVSNPITDSTTSELTYYLKTLGAKGEIIACFKFNPIFKESTLVVGKWEGK
jgi:hypothetical protein